MVKKQILPVQVSTWDALTAVAAEGWTVVHVDLALYRSDPGPIRNVMGRNGYVLSAKPGKSGVFFLLQTGPRRFQHDCHEIHDPANIL